MFEEIVAKIESGHNRFYKAVQTAQDRIELAKKETTAQSELRKKQVEGAINAFIRETDYVEEVRSLYDYIRTYAEKKPIEESMKKVSDDTAFLSQPAILTEQELNVLYERNKGNNIFIRALNDYSKKNGLNLLFYERNADAIHEWFTYYDVLIHPFYVDDIESRINLACNAYRLHLRCYDIMFKQLQERCNELVKA